MVKRKLRHLVYRSNVLKKSWLTATNIRIEYLFQYRKIRNGLYFIYLTRMKGYREITFEKKITNGIFKVFLKEDTSSVVKVTRRDNTNSYNFHRDIKKPAIHRKYTSILRNANETETIGTHIAGVSRVFADGGYESPYIQGENLQVLKLELLAGESHFRYGETERLLSAVEELINNLTTYSQKHETLTGDWMLYNLVYGTASGKIMNIDVEGFYTFKGNQKENNVERVKKELEEFSLLLKQRHPAPSNAAVN